MEQNKVQVQKNFFQKNTVGSRGLYNRNVCSIQSTEMSANKQFIAKIEIYIILFLILVSDCEL